MTTAVNALNSPDAEQRAWMVQAINHAVPLMPELATTDTIRALAKLHTDQASDVRSSAADAVVSAVSADPKLAGQALDKYISALNQDLSPQDRTIATQVLFLLAINDDANGTRLKTSLAPLVASGEPHVRIAASKALDMLEIAALAHKAARSADQRDKTVQTLEELQNSNQRDSSLLDADFDVVVDYTHDWLQRQKVMGGSK